MKIFVGNLNYDTRENDLQTLFADFGEVTSVKILTDNYTGRSRGFAFVEMEADGGAAAIQKLNGSTFNDRSIVVNEARPQRTTERNFSR